MSGVKFDTSAFDRDAAGLLAKVMTGGTRGMHDATDDLLRVSRDLAPLDKTTLRTTAWKEVGEADGLVIGEVFYSAVESGSSGRFNYALYQHELGSDENKTAIAYKNPTTPRTQPKFLERPLKMYADEYRDWIAEEIRKELK